MRLGLREQLSGDDGALFRSAVGCKRDSEHSKREQAQNKHAA
jgi:hypothetical protein